MNMANYKRQDEAFNCGGTEEYERKKPNYISLIEEHWRWNREDGLSPIAGYLYFYLLHYSNSLYWKRRFNLTNRIICADLGITEKTLISARAKLVESERIRFEPGKTKIEASIYEILGCKNSTPNSSTNGSPNEKKAVKIPANNIDKTTDKTKTEETTIESSPPTLEEVERLFLERGEMRDEAKRFYDYYEAQGWVTSAGQKIKRLDSMVNRWLTNDKRKIEKQYAKNNGKYVNSEEAREKRAKSFREYIARKLAST